MLFIFGLVIAFIGTKIALNYPGVDPNTAFIDMLANLPTSAPWLAIIAAFGLFAALISTADTELLTISTLLNKEVSRTEQKTIQHGLSTQHTKLIVLITTIIAVAITLFKSISLVSIYFSLLNLFMILGVVAFASFIGRGRPRAIAGGMILGVLVLIYISFKNLPATNAAYNLLVIIPPLVFCLWQRNNFYRQLELRHCN
jgi:Na+/proline symporter